MSIRSNPHLFLQTGSYWHFEGYEIAYSLTACCPWKGEINNMGNAYPGFKQRDLINFSTAAGFTMLTRNYVFGMLSLLDSKE